MNEIVAGILGSLAASIITATYYELKISMNNRDPFIKFLKINTNKQIKLCYGNIQSSNVYKSPIATIIPTVSFDYGEAESILLVYDKFRKQFQNKTRWIKNEIPISSQNDNIICIGGPKWNKTTEQLLGEIGSPFYYSNSVQGLIEKRITHDKENIHLFNFTKNQNYIEITDYGCLICARNNILKNDIDCALIVSGYTTYGTLFAAEALNKMSATEIKNISKSLGNDNKFAVLVKGEIKLDLSGRIASGVKLEIVTWIGERDFMHPYNYKY